MCLWSGERDRINLIQQIVGFRQPMPQAVEGVALLGPWSSLVEMARWLRKMLNFEQKTSDVRESIYNIYEILQYHN